MIEIQQTTKRFMRTAQMGDCHLDLLEWNEDGEPREFGLIHWKMPRGVAKTILKLDEAMWLREALCEMLGD